MRKLTPPLCEHATGNIAYAMGLGCIWVEDIDNRGAAIDTIVTVKIKLKFVAHQRRLRMLDNEVRPG